MYCKARNTILYVVIFLGILAIVGHLYTRMLIPNKEKEYSIDQAKSTNMLHQPVYDNDISIMTIPKKQTFDIPRLLHIQWKNEIIPDFAVPFIKRWKEYHPKLTLMFWTDKSMAEFIDHVYEGTNFQKFYKSIDWSINRVDLMRYVIMYHFGGIYADLDVYPLRSLEPILGPHSCIVAREPEPYPASIGMESSLLASNILFISKKGHPFWLTAISHSRNLPPKTNPLHFAGPIAVTRSLKKYATLNERNTLDTSVFLAPSLYFYPPPEPKGDQIHLNNFKNQCTHLHNGSSVFMKRMCRVYRTEHRIDWSDMYRHPRYFQASFTKHHMFSSWFNPVRSVKGTTQIRDIFQTKLIKFDSVKQSYITSTDPFERDAMTVKTA